MFLNAELLQQEHFVRMKPEYWQDTAFPSYVVTWKILQMLYEK